MKRKWTWIVMLLIVLSAIALVMRVLSVDAYGECRKLRNFWLCFEGVIDPPNGGFKRLVSDDELIARFQQHRAEFDQMVGYAQRSNQGAEW